MSRRVNIAAGPNERLFINPTGLPGQLALGSFEMAPNADEVAADETLKKLEHYTAVQKQLQQRCKNPATTMTRAQLDCAVTCANLCHKQKLATFENYRFSFINYAHRLFCSDTLQRNAAITMPSTSAVPKALAQIMNASVARQFDTTARVPEKQTATSMWARMFALFEKCTRAERLYNAHLKPLFHNCIHVDNDGNDGNDGNGDAAKKPLRCACFAACLQGKLADGTAANPDVALQESRGRCVAATLFDQFYIPICFARRSALARDTCLADGLVRNLSFARSDDIAADTEFLLQQQLLDVQLLSLTDAIGLAMSALEHPAAMFAFPPPTVSQMRLQVDEEEELANEDAETRKKKLRAQPRVDIFAPHADINVYDSAPERMEHRCENTSEFHQMAREAIRNAQRVREEIRERKMQQQESSCTQPAPQPPLQHVREEQRAPSVKPPSNDPEWTRILEQRRQQELRRQRQRQESVAPTPADNFQDAAENESLRDGVHDRFSEERIEVYRTFIDGNGSAATALYARFHTKVAAPSAAAVPVAAASAANRASVTALAALLPMAIRSDARAVERFEAFCTAHWVQIANEYGQPLDEAAALRLHAMSRIADASRATATNSSAAAESAASRAAASSNSSSTLKEVLGASLAERLCAVAEEKLLEQLAVPNYRAFCASLLLQLDRWLDRLLATILEPAEHWLSLQYTGSSVDIVNTSAFQQYCDECRLGLPWLFAERDERAQPIFTCPRLEPLAGNGPEPQRDQSMLECQYRRNCARLWSMKQSIAYFNTFILHDNNVENRSAFNTPHGDWAESAAATTMAAATAKRGRHEEAFSAAAAKCDELLQTALRARTVCASDELRSLLARDNDISLESRSRDAIWTICCEPLQEGTELFSANPGCDPLCTATMFAANQQRNPDRQKKSHHNSDSTEQNPYKMVQSYLWQLFACDWRADPDGLQLPQVAQFAHRIVCEYARQNLIPVTAQEDAQPNGLYLCLCQTKMKDYSHLPNNDLRRVAMNMRQILTQFHETLKRPQIGRDEYANVTLNHDYVGQSSTSGIDASTVRWRRLLNFYAYRQHLRLAIGNNYEFTMPFTTLYSVAQSMARKKPAAITQCNPAVQQRFVKRKRDRLATHADTTTTAGVASEAVKAQAIETDTASKSDTATPSSSSSGSSSGSGSGGSSGSGRSSSATRKSSASKEYQSIADGASLGRRCRQKKE